MNDSEIREVVLQTAVAVGLNPVELSLTIRWLDKDRTRGVLRLEDSAELIYRGRIFPGMTPEEIGQDVGYLLLQYKHMEEQAPKTKVDLTGIALILAAPILSAYISYLTARKVKEFLGDNSLFSYLERNNDLSEGYEPYMLNSPAELVNDITVLYAYKDAIPWLLVDESRIPQTIRDLVSPLQKAFEGISKVSIIPDEKMIALVLFAVMHYNKVRLGESVRSGRLILNEPDDAFNPQDYILNRQVPMRIEVAVERMYHEMNAAYQKLIQPIPDSAKRFIGRLLE